MSFVCTADDMHPYQCSKTCIHCAAQKTDNHDPYRCWLCCDGDPDGEYGPCASVEKP